MQGARLKIVAALESPQVSASMHRRASAVGPSSTGGWGRKWARGQTDNALAPEMGMNGSCAANTAAARR
jgi:hypothetical protein